VKVDSIPGGWCRWTQYLEAGGGDLNTWRLVEVDSNNWRLVEVDSNT